RSLSSSPWPSPPWPAPLDSRPMGTVVWAAASVRPGDKLVAQVVRPLAEWAREEPGARRAFLVPEARVEYLEPREPVEPREAAARPPTGVRVRTARSARTATAPRAGRWESAAR